MAIAALSDSTKRLLGSPVVVSTPVSLVKELLDNAIDAKATTIEVLISLNTIDKIEVRDNGTGIDANNYDSLARPGHTSKLQTFEELRLLGGTTLGFRGEALASANALAKIAITTRTTTEPVATVIQIVPKTGGVLSRQPGSAPTGTTVSATALYDELPVRKQVALKGSAKSLDNIKDLLRSYAMARPQLRLMLKILKNPKFNWSYTPNTDTGPIESTLQLFGTEAASGCFHKTGNHLSLVPRGRVNQVQDDQSTRLFVFDALLMKPNAGSKLPKHRYISVDHRPISHSSRTAKMLMSVYRRYVNRIRDKDIPSGDLFIRIDIGCPSGSYDSNVEPAKDDVLFEDESALMKQFECFCEEVYGPSTFLRAGRASPLRVLSKSCHLIDGGSPPADARLPVNTASDGHREDGMQTVELARDLTLVAQPHDSSTGTQSEVIGEPAQESLEERSLGSPPVRVRSRASTPPPGAWTATAPSLPAGEERESPPDSYPQRNSDSLRPMHRKPAQPSQTVYPRCDGQRDPEATTPLRGVTILPSSPHHPAFAQAGILSSSNAQIHDYISSETASRSENASEPDILRHFAAPPRDLEVPPSLRCPAIPVTHAQGRPASNGVPGGPYRSPVSSPAMMVRDSGSRRRQINVSSRCHAQPLWTPPSSIHKEHNSSKRPSGNFPRDRTKQTTLSFGANRDLDTSRVHIGNETHRLPRENDCVFSTAKHHLLRQTDNRHDRGTAVRNPVLGNKSPDQQEQSIHQPFATLHTTNLQPAQHNTVPSEPIQTSLPSGDPRAYLLRRQKSMAAVGSVSKQIKLRRMKSNLLPLQSTPVDDQTYDLVTNSGVDVRHLLELAKNVERYDLYIAEGDIQKGLDMDLEESRRIEVRLNHILASWSEAAAGQQKHTHVSLRESLKQGHSTALYV